MREFYFKGKSILNKKWLYGDLVHDKNGNCYILEYDINDVARGLVIMMTSEVYPETIGHYTGLTDINGKEIFAGDIISNEYEIGKTQINKIVYCKEEAKYKFVNAYKMTGEISKNIGTMKIIGNIHDNGELLEV